MKQKKKLVGRRLLALLLTLTMLLGMMPVTAFGTEDLIEISDENGLRAMASKGGSYQLTADIGLSDWTTIETFSGILDGNGHTITLNGNPLFENMSGTVMNLTVNGTVTENGTNPTGSITRNCTGTIRNCIVDANIIYSGGGSQVFVGGISGKITGTISNCLVLGEIIKGNTACYGGVANITEFGSGTIENCIVVGNERIGSKEGTDWSDFSTVFNPLSGTNCTLITDASTFDPESFLNHFNGNLSSGDLEWELVENNLQIKKPAAGTPATEEDLAILMEAIEMAGNVDKTKLYTANSWAEFSNALTTATEKTKEASPGKTSVLKAAQNLTTAAIGLVEREVTAVDIDALAEVAGKEVTTISTVTELADMKVGEYYRLEADLEIVQSDWWSGYYETTMNWVLDGNGHTITLSNGTPLWKAIGENGVVQNLGIKGTAKYSTNHTGAIAMECAGRIINCWTLADVTAQGNNNVDKDAGGFVAILKSGGAVINSWNAGMLKAAGNVGGIAGTAEENTLIKNCYWMNGDDAVGSGEGIVNESSEKNRSDFYSTEFIALLNTNRGNHGSQWNLCSSGYPWFGEEQTYEEENVEITFTSHDGTVTTFSSIDGLNLYLGDWNEERFGGTLSLEGATSWTNLDYNTSNQILLLYDGEEGKVVYPNKKGTARIQADYGTGKSVVFPINILDPRDAYAIRLRHRDQVFYDGDNLTVQGSEYVYFKTEAQYEENGNWKQLPTQIFTFTGANGTGIACVSDELFYAGAPGTMSVTADGAGRSITVNITSEYVPMTSIRPAASGTYHIHGRNPNSSNAGDFLDLTLSHGAGQVIIEPENASYRNAWTITSSNADVVEYMPSSVVAVLPKKSGTVTLTAISTDPNLQEPVSGTSNVTIQYANPVVEVSVSPEAITVKENETIDLPLTFVGTNDQYEYVTEPQMEWTFESPDGGEVEIGRETVYLYFEEVAGEERCVANPTYKLSGVSKGTVTVTGTPLDKTNDVTPVSFTVTVETGEEETPVDSLQIAKDGIQNAKNYLLNTMGSGYTYGYEWEVLSLTRSGKAVETAGYLDSVEAKYTSELEKDGLDTKPTTMARVAVALGTIGEDASDFRGIDFIDMICNTDRITEGGNEPMWALIALDSRDYPVPEGAKWTREKLVSEILSKYQNTQTGAFGLNDNVSTSIDMTAMALQALAPYVGQRKDVADAVDKALEYLKAEMNRDAGYGGTVESAAQVLTALTALDIDAADVETGFAKSVARNLITNIMSFKVEDGEGFKHQADDKTAQNMSSIQALYSLESYRRFAENENAFFDLTDVNMRGLLQSKIDDAESLMEDDYTEESWNALQSVLEEAKVVVGDLSSTDEELKNAADAVAAAIAALEAAKSEGGSVAPEVKTITVKFRLVGDTKHEAAEDHNGYVNWIKTFNVTIPEDGTVYDAFVAALDKKGMDFEEGQHSYISSIKAPAAAGGYWLGEYDNGPYSGWKYIVNGEYPNVGLRYYWLEDGDSIVWRYVDDYTDREDATDKWEEAADVAPTKPSSNVTDSKEEEQKSSASLTPEATTNSKGEASVTIKKDELTSAVEEATKDNTAGTVVIAPEIKGDASKVTVELPKEAVESMATSGKTDLTVKTDIAAVTLPAETLKDLPTAGKTVSVAVETVKGDAAAEAGSTAAADKIKVEVAVDNKAVDKIGSGIVASIPAKEASPTTVLVIVDAEGNETIVKKSATAEGEITALLEGSCTVVVKDNKKEFTDTEGHWGKSAAEFASSRELFNGVGNGKFGMNTTMNRAMMATVFYNLENGPDHDGEHDFHDVQEGKYYAKPVAWAAESGVLSGYSDGSFRADAPVTREQLAVMLWNYSGKPSGIKALDHSDAGNISNYAKEAMQWAVENGVMSGRANGQLDPKGAATRAEVAQMFKNYIEKVVL